MQRYRASSIDTDIEDFSCFDLDYINHPLEKLDMIYKLSSVHQHAKEKTSFRLNEWNNETLQIFHHNENGRQWLLQAPYNDPPIHEVPDIYKLAFLD